MRADGVGEHDEESDECQLGTVDIEPFINNQPHKHQHDSEGVRGADSVRTCVVVRQSENAHTSDEHEIDADHHKQDDNHVQNHWSSIRFVSMYLAIAMVPRNPRTA